MFASHIFFCFVIESATFITQKQKRVQFSVPATAAT